MKIGLVGPSYVQRSLPFNAQRTVNLYPIIDEQGSETASLQGTPGLVQFSSGGNGPVRNSFVSGNERVFYVSGASLYELDSNGTSTFRGTLLTSQGNISMAEDINTLAICDGNRLYSFDYSTNTLGAISASGLPSSVGFVTNIDGYFVVSENDSGRFYISGINDIATWNALDFATAESKPDYLVSVVNAVGQLWLFGKRTTEIWTNTGSSVFPFSRVS